MILKLTKYLSFVTFFYEKQNLFSAYTYMMNIFSLYYYIDTLYTQNTVVPIFLCINF